jgi:alginate O-acetyltransferase complex protein AlgI
VLFPTVTFAVFFAVVLAVAWGLASRPRAWRAWLLIASAVFYAWWDLRFVALLALTVAVCHVVGRRIAHHGDGAQGRRWLIVGIGLLLAVLGWFKYYGFFVTALLDALRPLGLEPHLPLVQVLLPVGISFFTFEAISYLVEVRRGVTRPPPLLDLATYLTFFPKLQSGPITRASEFLPQLAPLRPPTELVSSQAFLLIGRGLFKKVVLASFLAEAIVDDVFATPMAYSAAEVLVGIYAYTMLIYVDFSGYTDLARGLARLLGIDLPINFDRPYAARSIQDFWTRWHVSLSRWLRDFLFYPLARAGNRGRIATARNILIVMLLAGLWHGAAWTFVLWGGVHGLGLVRDRWLRDHHRRTGVRPADSPWRLARQRLVTFHIVAFAWVLFRADSVPHAIEVLSRLGAWGPFPAVTPLLLLVLVAIIGAQYLPRDLGARLDGAFVRLRPVGQVAALGALLLATDALGPEGIAPFIYFRF